MIRGVNNERWALHTNFFAIRTHYEENLDDQGEVESVDLGISSPHALQEIQLQTRYQNGTSETSGKSNWKKNF